jgi:hypothetical protein
MLLNASSLELTKVKIVENDSWDEFPLSIEELFAGVNSDLSAL